MLKWGVPAHGDAIPFRWWESTQDLFISLDQEITQMISRPTGNYVLTMNHLKLKSQKIQPDERVPCRFQPLPSMNSHLWMGKKVTMTPVSNSDLEYLTMQLCRVTYLLYSPERLLWCP